MNVFNAMGVLCLTFFNFAIAQVTTTTSIDPFDTINHQFIAAGVAMFTQFLAVLWFERKGTVKKLGAQIVLAGVAAYALIGVFRDVLNLKIALGGETGIASFFGWIGVEAAFGIAGRILNARGIPIQMEEEKNVGVPDNNQ